MNVASMDAMWWVTETDEGDCAIEAESKLGSRLIAEPTRMYSQQRQLAAFLQLFLAKL